MNLYLLTQNVNRGYDTHDSIVVAALDEEQARNTQPWGNTEWGNTYSSWAYNPDDVKVSLIGKATEKIEAGVILASFNAG